MSMSPRDWLDQASVYRSGASVAAAYVMNAALQQQAEILEAMALQCERQAMRRNMTPDQLAVDDRAERNCLTTGLYRCKKLVYPSSGIHRGRCRLHRDHIMDGTDHIDLDWHVLAHSEDDER